MQRALKRWQLELKELQEKAAAHEELILEARSRWCCNATEYRDDGFNYCPHESSKGVRQEIWGLFRVSTYTWHHIRCKTDTIEKYSEELEGYEHWVAEGMPNEPLKATMTMNGE